MLNMSEPLTFYLNFWLGWVEVFSCKSSLLVIIFRRTVGRFVKDLYTRVRIHLSAYHYPG